MHKLGMQHHRFTLKFALAAMMLMGVGCGTINIGLQIESLFLLLIGWHVFFCVGGAGLGWVVDGKDGAGAGLVFGMFLALVAFVTSVSWKMGE